MGGRSREAIQDAELSRMDKITKHSKGERNGRVMTTSEMVAEEKRRAGLSPEERMKDMSGSDWSRGLKEYLDSKEVRLRHGSFNQRFLTWLFNRKKAELGAYHARGAKYSEMIPWLRALSDDHMNM